MLCEVGRLANENGDQLVQARGLWWPGPGGNGNGEK